MRGTFVTGDNALPDQSIFNALRYRTVDLDSGG